MKSLLTPWGPIRYRAGPSVDKNMAQSRFLEGLVRDSPNFELLVSGPLPIANFRYRGSRRPSEKALNRPNASLVSEIQKRGIAIPSLYAIGGKSCVRVCNLNQRSQRSDFEALVQACEQLGVELEARTGHKAVQPVKIRRVAARRRCGPDRSEGAQIIKQGRLLRRFPDE